MSSFNTNCSVSRERIIDFLLEELSYKETAALDEHIRTCAACQASVDSYIHSFDFMRSIDMPAVTSNTYFNLKQRLSVRKQHNGGKKLLRKEPYLHMVSLAASAVAVLVFTIVFSNNIYNADLASPGPSGYDAWMLDTVIVNAMSTFAPVHDSLAFLGAIPMFPKNMDISMVNIQTKFYSFTSDMLADYAARSAMTMQLSPNATPFLPIKKKPISFIPNTENPLFYLRQRSMPPIIGIQEKQFLMI